MMVIEEEVYFDGKGWCWGILVGEVRLDYGIVFLILFFSLVFIDVCLSFIGKGL